MCLVCRHGRTFLGASFFHSWPGPLCVDGAREPEPRELLGEGGEEAGDEIGSHSFMGSFFFLELPFVWW